MTPDLRQLRYFVAVAEESSFTQAAARLMITQQSLSQQITALERILGAKLFDRDSRGTKLTDIGALFLPEARAVLDRADEAVTVIRRALRGETGGSAWPSWPPSRTTCFHRLSEPHGNVCPTWNSARRRPPSGRSSEACSTAGTTSRSPARRTSPASPPAPSPPNKCAPSCPRGIRSPTAPS
ncbi:hypothetical protein GCM10027612_04970 [Microbispora bryophytorum subsp. camponoti]